ncbi:MAG: RNA polymerase sigma factor [Opitutales bacterium]
MGENAEDIALLERVGQGDESALIMLMARYKEALFRFAFRYLGNASDSQEVVEDTFFRVYKNAYRFTPKATVKTWIFAIILNLCRDRLRKAEREKQRILTIESEKLELENIDSGASNPAVENQYRDDLRRVQACIQKLPEKLKFPFIFCVLEDHSYDECALVLNTNRKTVETRIYRARKLMKSELLEMREKV